MVVIKCRALSCLAKLSSRFREFRQSRNLSQSISLRPFVVAHKGSTSGKRGKYMTLNVVIACQKVDGDHDREICCRVHVSLPSIF